MAVFRFEHRRCEIASDSSVQTLTILMRIGLLARYRRAECRFGGTTNFWERFFAANGRLGRQRIGR